MHLPLSEKDIILASSEYANMAIALKIIIERLKNNIQCLHRHETFENSLLSWVTEMQDRFKEFELYGRVSYSSIYKSESLLNLL